ncbi:MAG: tetratricopeptide repeat protein [Planctomycetes bacterium]|nr:tetratricopeptide repeat protein [Planctomycetota bacterium]
MAGRVNKQFVVSLSVGLFLAFGVVAGSAYYLLKNSAKDLAKAGDRAVAASDFPKAIEYYSKAVNKEQTNTINLEKWRDTLKKVSADTPVQYKNYFDQYKMATRQLARVRKDDLKTQAEYLEIIRDTESVDSYVSESDMVVSLHAADEKGGKWDAIRRFRGHAKQQAFAMTPDAKIETAKEAEADLLAAIAADPTDSESIATLQALYSIMADRAAAKSAMDEAKALRAKAEALVTEYATKNPQDPLMQLMALMRDLNKWQVDFQEKLATSKMTRDEQKEEVKKLEQIAKPRLDQVLQLAKAADASRLTTLLIMQFRRIEELVDPASRGARVEEICRIALEKRPDDAELMGARAEIMSTRGDYSAAIDQLQKIADLPRPTTSLKGLRLFPIKNNALYFQALYAGKAFQLVKESDKAGQAKAIALAKEFRSRLAGVYQSDAPEMLLVDGHLAFAENDLAKANRLLDQYIKATSKRPNPDALFLSAMIADKINQLGLARDRLEELLKIAPNKLEASFVLADVQTRLQNYDKALELYDRLLQIMPENPELKARKERIEGVVKKDAAVDPIQRVLVEADRMLNPPPGQQARPEELIPFLEREVVKNNLDWRLVVSLSNAYLRAGDKAKALDLVKKAIEKYPESKELKDYQLAASSDDPLSARIAQINASQVADLDKILARYATYRGAGKLKEAGDELELAVKAAPDDKRVIEFRFLDAIDDKKFDVAQTLADQAAKQNADEADGLTFRARLHAAEGRYPEAVAAMEAAVAKGGALPETWRLKGRMERFAGKPADAAESFRRAVQLRPGEIGAINDLLTSLVSLGRKDEALTFARESEKYGRDDVNFINIWLGLEAAVGVKTTAIERRETMSKNSPNDRENLLILANLYIEERNWAKARPLIDRAAKLQEGLDVVGLDAAWNWEQGEREKARSIIEAYIAKINKDKPTVGPLLQYAGFLVQRKDFDGAGAVLDKARALQDPKIAEADKSIVDLQMRLGNNEAAVDVCRRIISAGADPDNVYRQRMAECLIKVGNFAEAQKELEAMNAGKDSDVTNLLLLADCKAGLKDARGQRELLDLAVAKFPGDATVFIKRGQAMLADPKFARDAIADFTKAIQLRPDLWQPYRLRAAAYVSADQVEDGVRDLRQALKLAPGNDDLLYGLVADFVRLGRTADALDVANQAIAQRPRDVNAMITIGQIFASSDDHQDACRFYKQAFDIDPNDRIAQRYLDSLLIGQGADTAEATRVLTKMGPDRIKTNPGFLMAVAKLSMRQGKQVEAAAAARDALKLLRTDEPTIMLAWFNDLRRLITKKETLLAYLDETGRMAAASQAQEWIEYFRVVANLDDVNTRKAAVQPARDLLAKAKDASIRQLLFRAVSSALIASEEYAEAARVMREGLGVFPEDVEMNNNMAFVLADKLDNAADAVELAEKAVKLAPAVADVQETAGTVMMANKRYADALNYYKRALLLASNPEQTVRFATRVVQAHLKLEDKASARDACKEIRKAIDQDPTKISDAAKAGYEAVRKEAER